MYGEVSLNRRLQAAGRMPDSEERAGKQGRRSVNECQ